MTLNTAQMQRIMIIGGPGSGKSTLGQKMAEVLDLPVFHMDHIHWESGWVERSATEKTRLSKEVHAKAQWIFEGNHSRSYADRIARADTLIWLDLPIALRLWRVTRRAWRFRGESRPDLPAGCPEQFGLQTLGFIWFIIRIRRKTRRKILAIWANPPAHILLYHLRNRRAVQQFLDAVTTDAEQRP